VRIESGCGTDAATIQRTLRLLKRGMDNGVRSAMARHESHMKPSERRRAKQVRARRRAAKAQRLEQRRAAVGR
jgi:ribosomal protein S21